MEKIVCGQNVQYDNMEWREKKYISKEIKKQQQKKNQAAKQRAAEEKKIVEFGWNNSQTYDRSRKKNALHRC